MRKPRIKVAGWIRFGAATLASVPLLSFIGSQGWRWYEESAHDRAGITARYRALKGDAVLDFMQYVSGRAREAPPWLRELDIKQLVVPPGALNARLLSASVGSYQRKFDPVVLLLLKNEGPRPAREVNIAGAGGDNLSVGNLDVGGGVAIAVRLTDFGFGSESEWAVASIEVKSDRERKDRMTVPLPPAVAAMAPIVGEPNVGAYYPK